MQLVHLGARHDDLRFELSLGLAQRGLGPGEPGLTLVEDRQLEVDAGKRYLVGTGEHNKTPVGEFKIKDRIAEPPWWQPNGQKIEYGDPDHLIGTRWMGITKAGYGIHGIRDDLADTIGKQMSAGCIRMLNPEVEELFVYIPVGTTVTIQD